MFWQTPKPILTFDDRNLPPNNISVERAEEIEQAARPLLREMLEKLRKEKPHLFRSVSSK